MIINADKVVDIKTDTPGSEDVFFVDTNAWFWLTYERFSLSSSGPLRHQIDFYPQYLEAVVEAEAKIYRSGLILSEISHLIEKYEFEIHNKTSDYPVKNKKAFRADQSQRENVIARLEESWSTIKSMSFPIENEVINESVTDSALERLKSQLIDGYDIFLLESINRERINKVISDDSDMASVHGITLFTANRNVIGNANVQGKLLHR